MAPTRLKLFGFFGAAFLFFAASAVFAFTGPTNNPGVGGGALYVDGNGYLGVSTTNPQALLDVNGNITVANSSGYRWGAGTTRIDGSDSPDYLQFVVNDANAIYITSGGSVGVGTTTPASTLHVVGTTRTSSGFYGNGANITSIDPANTIGGPFSSANYAFPLSLGVGTSTTALLPQALSVYGGGYFSGSVDVGGQLDATTGLCIGGSCKTSWADYWLLSSSNLYPSSTAWNLGVGTTTPNYKLTVQGPIYSTGSSTASAFCLAGTCQTSWSGLGQWANGTGGIYYEGKVGVGVSTLSYPLFVSTSTDSLFALQRVGATYPTIFKQGTDGVLVVNNANKDTLTLKDGYVGVGVTNPLVSLHVATSVYIGYSDWSDTDRLTIWGNAYIRRTGSGEGTHYKYAGIYGDGNLTLSANGGTGTINLSAASLTMPVTVSVGNLSSAYGVPLSLYRRNWSYDAGLETLSLISLSNDYAATDGAAINFYSYYNSTTTKTGQITGSLTGSASYGALRFSSSINGVYSEVMRLTNGRVSIATTTPSYTLDVVGTGQFSQPVLVGTPTANSHAVTKSYLDSALSGISSSSQWTATSTGIYYSGGNVGIGTANPTEKLQVYGAGQAIAVTDSGTAGNQLLLEADGTNGPMISSHTNSAGASTLNAAASRWMINAWGQVFQTSVATVPGNTRTFTTRMIIQPNGNIGLGGTIDKTTLAGASMVVLSGGGVGIATTTPSYALDVIGTGRFTQPVSVGAPTASGHATTKSYVDGLFVNPTFTGVASFDAISVSGTSTFSGNIIFSGNAASNLNMNGNSITGVNKLTVSTIDPVYTIGGQKYATYVSDSIGIKVVALGKGKITADGTYVIDFKKAEKGSDEWLFWQTIDEGAGMADVTVFLTPEGVNAALWYELKPASRQIIVHGAKSIKFSYQLSAPRHDAKEWGNITNTSEKGISLPVR